MSVVVADQCIINVVSDQCIINVVSKHVTQVEHGLSRFMAVHESKYWCCHILQEKEQYHQFNGEV